MTDGVHQRLPQGFERKKGFVDALKQARLYATRDGEMPAQEEHRFLEDGEAVPVDLALVEELILGRALEAGELEKALRVLGGQTGDVAKAAEQCDGGVHGGAAGQELEPFQNGRNR